MENKGNAFLDQSRPRLTNAFCLDSVKKFKDKLPPDRRSNFSLDDSCMFIPASTVKIKVKNLIDDAIVFYYHVTSVHFKVFMISRPLLNCC